MRPGAFVTILARDLRRASGSFILAAIGISVGIAALVFFLALGAGMRSVVLGRIFPIDRIEVVPRDQSVGALAALLGARAEGIPQSSVDTLARTEGVRAVYPKLRLLFPHSGRGGQEVFGRMIGAGELVADGIDPALVRGELAPGVRFEDTQNQGSGRECRRHDECPDGEKCSTEIAPNGASVLPGRCVAPIPALVSPYLLEVFDGAIAPAHGLPPVARSLAQHARGIELEWDLGRAGLGFAQRGTQRRVYARIVGVTPRAIDLGITVPLSVARRLNAEYAGAAAAEQYTSLIIVVSHPEHTTTITQKVRELGLEVRTSGAEQMGLLVSVITAVLSLTSAVIVLLAALSIAHALGARVREREGEIALLRVCGARRADVFLLVIAEALVVGLIASGIGALGARALGVGWNRLLAAKLPAFPFKPDNWFVWTPRDVLISCAFGVLACALSALLPARRAASTDPSLVLSRGVN